MGFPPVYDFTSMKAMTTRLVGWTVPPKMFPLRSVTDSDDVK